MFLISFFLILLCIRFGNAPIIQCLGDDFLNIGAQSTAALFHVRFIDNDQYGYFRILDGRTR